MKLTNLSFHRKGRGVEEFNLIHKSHAGLEALAHQFDELQWVKEVNPFHKSYEFPPFYGGGGLKALPH